MAEKAAKTMAIAAFDSRIHLANNQKSQFIENLVRKYIPNVVRGVCEEFPSYFDKGKWASITTPRTYSDGYVGHEDYIGAPISFYLPLGSQYINVASLEYKELKKLHMSVKALEEQQMNFKQQVFDALCALKTENKIKESLPEALPYLEFPEEVHLPAPIFGTLRQIIKNIKPEEKQEKDG